MPDGYYAIVAPKLIRKDIRELSEQSQRELMRLNRSCREGDGRARWLLDRLLPQAQTETDTKLHLSELLSANGFDRAQHEQIRSDLLSGRIGLSENRLPPQTVIEDVSLDDIVDVRNCLAGRTNSEVDSSLGRQAIDYIDNLPQQCMHPVGHWYEIPNMMRNGLLHSNDNGTAVAEILTIAQHRYLRRQFKSVGIE